MCAEWCLICECEPIDNHDWFYDKKTTESICPWCVRDITNNLEKVKEVCNIV